MMACVGLWPLWKGTTDTHETLICKNVFRRILSVLKGSVFFMGGAFAKPNDIDALRLCGFLSLSHFICFSPKWKILEVIGSSFQR